LQANGAGDLPGPCIDFNHKIKKHVIEFLDFEFSEIQAQVIRTCERNNVRICARHASFALVSDIPAALRYGKRGWATEAGCKQMLNAMIEIDAISTTAASETRVSCSGYRD
jgi:hypothetical protein